MTYIEPGDRVIVAARDWLGTPYLHQCSLKGVGCDCIGLIRGVWRDVEGKEPQILPAYSSAWAEISQREQLIEILDQYFEKVSLKEREVGDVLVFRMRRNSVAKHVGILSSKASFVHAYQSNCVTESSLSGFWSRRIDTVFRFPSVSHQRILDKENG